MYHIVICDDDKRFIQYMKKIILNAGVDKCDIIFHDFHSGEELVGCLINEFSCDLLIVDMRMKEMDGDETAEVFRKTFPTATLVFCSGVFQPTVKSFKTMPFRYLLKEYTDRHMLSEMQEILKEMIGNKVEPFIVGSYHYSSVKLRPSDILYIEIAKRGSYIHICPDVIEYKFEENIRAKERIGELYCKLKDFGFEYAHNSYIVNLKYVTKWSIRELTLIDGTKLSISRFKAKEFREAMTKVLAKKY